MSEQHENAPTAFPTRRALREAERQRSRGGARRGPDGSAGKADEGGARGAAKASTAVAPKRATAAAPSTTAEPTARQAGAQAAVRKPATASAARKPVTTNAARKPAPRPSHARRWLPRVAVLGSLAIATTAVPLSGMATPTSPSTASSTFGAVSALDVLAADPVDGTDLFDGSASFAADPLAAARAQLTAARTEDRNDVLQCGSSELEANGQVAASATTAPVEVMMPLVTGTYRLTSQYGYRWGGMHEGLDMAAPSGTPIHAVAAGEVTYVGYGLQGRSGMIIVLQHEVDGETFWTWYVHMYPDGIFVDVGQTVSAGEVIGEVGSYGNSTGPHLHLEVHVDDEATTVDPAVWLETHEAAPLTDENLACAAG